MGYLTTLTYSVCRKSHSEVGREDLLCVRTGYECLRVYGLKIKYKSKKMLEFLNTNALEEHTGILLF